LADFKEEGPIEILEKELRIVQREKLEKIRA
jgi:hypothetical protein